VIESKRWTLALLLVACGPDGAESAVEAWRASFAAPVGGSFVVTATGLDAAGDLYVFGTVSDAASTASLALVKYDPAGNQLWVAGVGDAATENQAGALAVDPAGGAWIAGATAAIGSLDRDYLTLRIDSDGSTAWSARWGGAAHGGDWANGVAGDGQGGVYVTGFTTTTGGSTDFSTVKYDARGHLEWTAIYDSGGDDAPGFGGPIAVDAAANVYVAGETGVVQYRPDGALGFSLHERAEAITIAPDGSIYTTAPQQTLRLDTSGRVIWRVLDGGTLVSATRATVFTSGVLMKANQDWDTRTLALDGSAGTKQWERVFDGGHQDLPSQLRTDGAGAVYVVGETWAPRGILGVLAPDCVTLKYDSDGTSAWVARDPSAGNGRGLALDASGDIYATGLTGTTIKYRQQAGSCGLLQSGCF
jgi:hypothetical protein